MKKASDTYRAGNGQKPEVPLSRLNDNDAEAINSQLPSVTTWANRSVDSVEKD